MRDLSNLKSMIFASTNINVLDKALAIQELELMETNELYYNKVGCTYGIKQIIGEPLLCEAFIWNKTLTGYEFWNEIESKLK